MAGFIIERGEIRPFLGMTARSSMGAAKAGEMRRRAAERRVATRIVMDLGGGGEGRFQAVRLTRSMIRVIRITMVHAWAWRHVYRKHLVWIKMRYSFHWRNVYVGGARMENTYLDTAKLFGRQEREEGALQVQLSQRLVCRPGNAVVTVG